MKCSGNGTAADYFRLHGVSGQMDAKTKYTSRAATMYKDLLSKKAQEDAVAFPGKVVIEGADVDEAAGSGKQQASKGNDDFFDESNWSSSSNNSLNAVSSSNGSSVPSVFKSAVKTASATSPAGKSALKEAISVDSSNADSETAEELPHVERKTSLVSTAANLSTTSGMSSLSTSNTAPGAKKKGGKLGVKKVNLGMTFEEMEAKAKQEANKRAELERQGLLDLEREKDARSAAAAAALFPSSSKFSGSTSNSSNSNPQSVTYSAPVVPKLGFGAVGPVGGTPAPTSATSSQSRLGGFGASAPPAPDTNGDSARTRFANARGISSDMYFERNAHAPIDAESSRKLQQLTGAQSISSDQFFDRQQTSSPQFNQNNIANMDVNDALYVAKSAASEFAHRFVSDAQDDLTKAKDLMSNASDKLSDFFKDMQNRY